MTMHQPIADARTQTLRFADSLDTLYRVIAKQDPWAAFAAVDWVREQHAPKHPEIATLTDSAEQPEAEWWADFATDAQAVAMLSACLKRLVRRPPVGEAAKKRAIVAIWNTLNEKERAAFLEMVDPGAKAKA